MVLALLLTYAAFAGVVFLLNPREFDFPTTTLLLSLTAASLAAVAYLSVSWWLNGRSYGAHLMGLHVVDRRGRNLRLGLALGRAVFCVTFPAGLTPAALLDSRHDDPCDHAHQHEPADHLQRRSPPCHLGDRVDVTEPHGREDSDRVIQRVQLGERFGPAVRVPRGHHEVDGGEGDEEQGNGHHDAAHRRRSGVGRPQDAANLPGEQSSNHAKAAEDRHDAVQLDSARHRGQEVPGDDAQGNQRRTEHLGHGEPPPGPRRKCLPFRPGDHSHVAPLARPRPVGAVRPTPSPSGARTRAAR